MVTECIEWHDNNVSHMPMPLLQIELILLSFLNIDTILAEQAQVYVPLSKYLSIGSRTDQLSSAVGPDERHSALILGCSGAALVTFPASAQSWWRSHSGQANRQTLERPSNSM